MKIRSMVMGLMVVGLILATGCRSNKGKGGAGAGGFDGMGVENVSDVPLLTDEFGQPLDLAGGARFEDIFAPVHGVDFKPVYFAFDSSVLAPSEAIKVEQVAQHLLQNHNHVLVVEGHCDERGSNEYNLSLGENRALSLCARLFDLGIETDRIQSRSYGEEKPAVMGSGEAVWRLNRRGEFLLFQK